MSNTQAEKSNPVTKPVAKPVTIPVLINKAKAELRTAGVNTRANRNLLESLGKYLEVLDKEPSPIAEQTKLDELQEKEGDPSEKLRDDYGEDSYKQITEEIKEYAEATYDAVKVKADPGHEVAAIMVRLLAEYQRGGGDPIFEGGTLNTGEYPFLLPLLAAGVSKDAYKAVGEPAVGPTVPVKTGASKAEREKAKWQKEYASNLKYVFKMVLNFDAISRDPGKIKGYLSSYNSNKWGVEHRREFKEYLQKELDPLLKDAREGKVGRNELNDFFYEHGVEFKIPPNLGGPENIVHILTVLDDALSEDDFDLGLFSSSIREVTRAFNTYLELSSSVDPSIWNKGMQNAFLETLQAGDVDELNEIKEKYSGYESGAVRLAERLWRNKAVSELMVESVFAYDWQYMANLQVGHAFDTANVVPGGEKEAFLAEESSVVKLALLHKYVLESSRFAGGKADFVSTLGGIDLQEAQKILDGTSEEETPETGRLVDNPRAYLGKMDLVTQYVFVQNTWNTLRSTNLEFYTREGDKLDGSVKVHDIDGDPAAKGLAVKNVLEVAETQILRMGRAGHLGFMLNAIPLALQHSGSYNQAIDLLGKIEMTSSNISNTDMYSHIGSGRVLWHYMMVQVPKNFLEANMDNYNQLIDMMLMNPMASGYMGEYMHKDMFAVQTIGEMLRKFVHVYARRSGAVRPADIWIHQAPQDFSLTDGMDRRGYESSRLARSMIPAMADIDPEAYAEFQQNIENMVTNSGDGGLIKWWGREPDMHEVFFDFFNPRKVKLVPKRRYAVIPMIPLSPSKLAMLLSGVEGVPRYIPKWDISSAGISGRGKGAAHGVTSTTGEEEQLDWTAGGNAYVFGPEQKIGCAYTGRKKREGSETEAIYEEGEEGEPIAVEVAPYRHTSSDQRHRWQALFDDAAVPLPNDKWISVSGYGWGTHAATEETAMVPQHMVPGVEVEGPPSPVTMQPMGSMHKVQDDRVIAVLNTYAEESNTDGVTILKVKKSAIERTESGGEEEVLESITEKDLRAFTWGRIKGNWYRIGYVDLEPENLQRLFTALNLDSYGEFRQLSGKQEFEAGGKTRVEGEQDWRLYGALLGFNLTNIFTGGGPPADAPSVVTAGILDKGDRPPRRGVYEGQALPSLATEEDLQMKVNEYAAGLSILLKGEYGGMERAVGFVTAVGRKARKEDETLEQGRGGAGIMGRMGTIRQEKIKKTGKLGLEFGAAVEESWGDDVVGVTLAWQDAQVIKHEQYNIAIANIRQDLSNYGLIGTMHDSEGINWFLVGDWRYLSKHAQWRSGQTSHAGELGALEVEHFRIQESVLWQHIQTRWSLSRVTARLHDVETQLQDLRRGGITPGVGQTGAAQTALEGDKSVQTTIDQLERQEVVLRRLQTALGLIEAQMLFGTVAVEWEFLDEKARAGIEAIWGGPDEWAALLNSYIEVDQKFAAAFNIQPAPWGSAGGKVVVPFTGFILAMTVGEYWREDLSGPNVNVGITRDPAKAFGIGAIIGGMARWGTLKEGEESRYETAGDLDYRRNVIEGMVLGWMPWWEGTRAQGYFVYAKEWGTNTYTIQEDLDIDRMGTGLKVLWIRENGMAYTLNTEWLRKKVASTMGGTGIKLMDQTKDDIGVGFEVKGGDDQVGGRLRGVVSIIDRVMHDMTQREDPTNYKRTEWAAFADLFFTF